jgi:hypothetical protein
VLNVDGQAAAPSSMSTGRQIVQGLPHLLVGNLAPNSANDTPTPEPPVRAICSTSSTAELCGSMNGLTGSWEWPLHSIGVRARSVVADVAPARWSRDLPVSRAAGAATIADDQLPWADAART